MIRILLGALLGLGLLGTAGVRTAAAAQTAEIFVVNSSDSIMAYAPDKSGDVAPDWVMGLQLTPQGIARDSTGRIYVTNYWIDSVSVFAPGANGAAAPVATIRGSKTDLETPTGIAVNSQGKIYVVNGGDLYSAAGPRRVDIYAAGANGNVAPIAAIKGPHTRLETPTAVAVDPSGRIYVVDDVGDNPRVMIYPAGSNGDIPPVAIISGDKTGLVTPNGIAFDAKEKIYVTNDGSQFGREADSVTVYPANAQGNIAPIATISSDGIRDPRGIAVDSAGKIYVTNNDDPQKITVFPAGADGSPDPIVSIQGPQTELEEEIQGVTVSPTGEIYVASCPLSRPGKITEYAANSDGDVKPIATITDKVDTKLNSPRSIALDSSGQIYVANIENVTVYPSGTHSNAAPLFTIAGPFAQFINAPSGIALDSEKNIYLVNQAIGPYINGYASVFAPGSHDNTIRDLAQS
jgi:sugar lactone lactonase YvrE